MRLPRFEYVEPKSLKEASHLFALNAKGSVLLAGGTDLIIHMKQRLVQPKQVINLKTIPGLAYLRDGKDGLKLGTLTTLHNLGSSPLIQNRYPALSQAAREVGAYAHQTMGTLGGNLCQGNRCRFYNQSDFWRGVRSPCFKVGGKVCYVIPKSKDCHSTYCGDLAPVLIALDAQVQIIGPGGDRSIPLKKLYTHKGKKPLSLKKGEILKEILVPPSSGDTLYLKWRLRGSLEFPIISLAFHVERDGKQNMKKARIIFGAVGPGPIEAVLAEKIIMTGPFNEQWIEKVVDQAIKEIFPMRTSITSPSYKRKMAGVLLKQAWDKISS